MKLLSIEFTSNYIYLFEQKYEKGNVEVISKHKVETPANAYYNRMILNNDRGVSDAIKNCVAENGIKAKKTILVVPSTDNMVEELSIVDSKKKELDSLIEQELRKRHKLTSDYIYDYIIEGPDPTKDGFLKIQVTLCVKNMIQNLQDLVKKAGLTPYKVIFVNKAMEKLADSLHLMGARNSSIIGCVHNDEAHFMYVGHGEEPYYRFSKLKTENRMEENLFVLSSINNGEDGNQSEDDIALQRKIMDDITRLERFHRQRHPDGVSAKIFFYGSYNRFPELKTFLANTIGIEAEELPFEERANNVKYKYMDEEYVYNAIAATLTLSDSDDKQYDFFSKLVDEKTANADKFLYAPTMVAIPFFILVLIAIFVNKIELNKINKENEVLKAWIEDETIGQAYMDKKELIDTSLALTDYNEQVGEHIELIETMPRFESAIISKINSFCPTGTYITGYSYTSGNMVLSCYATDQYTPAQYAKNLQESGVYKKVEYTGFSKSVNSDGSDIYSFNINLKLW